MFIYVYCFPYSFLGITKGGVHMLRLAYTIQAHILRILNSDLCRKEKDWTPKEPKKLSIVVRLNSVTLSVNKERHLWSQKKEYWHDKSRGEKFNFNFNFNDDTCMIALREYWTMFAS